MEIREAQQKVDKLIKFYGGYWEPLSMFSRLVEEVGELSRAINIQYGGKKKKFENDGREIKEELADVLFTILALSNTLNIDLSKELGEKIKKDYKKCEGVYEKSDN